MMVVVLVGVVVKLPAVPGRAVVLTGLVLVVLAAAVDATSNLELKDKLMDMELLYMNQ